MVQLFLKTKSMFTPNETVFIINPNSGRRTAASIIQRAQKLQPGMTCLVTRSAEDFKLFIKQNINRYKVFIISGGDGTVNEAAKYLAGHSEKYLVIYPTGSGNGFAREMGFKRNLKSLFKTVYKGSVRTIDLLEINGDLCVNVAGLGFDSHIAHKFDESPGRGFINYFRLVINSVFSFKAFDAEIITENENHHDRFKIISVANTRQFGNNAIIAPNAKPDDNHFEIVLVKNLSIIQYPVFTFRLMTGLLKENKYVKFLKSNSEIIIKSEFKKIHIDGDPSTFNNYLKISLSEKKIKILN